MSAERSAEIRPAADIFPYAFYGAADFALVRRKTGQKLWPVVKRKDEGAVAGIKRACDSLRTLDCAIKPRLRPVPSKHAVACINRYYRAPARIRPADEKRPRQRKYKQRKHEQLKNKQEIFPEPPERRVGLKFL